MDTYNQIQGKIIIGYFRDNEIYKMNVNGNARTLYFQRDDKDSSLVGIYVIDAKYLKIYIHNRKLKGISNFDNVEGKIYPWDKMKKADMRLQGFVWRSEIRPLSKEDLFDDSKYADSIGKKKGEEEVVKDEPINGNSTE